MLGMWFISVSSRRQRPPIFTCRVGRMKRGRVRRETSHTLAITPQFPRRTVVLARLIMRKARPGCFFPAGLPLPCPTILALGLFWVAIVEGWRIPFVAQSYKYSISRSQYQHSPRLTAFNGLTSR
jgi:hypothetical protein